MTGTTIIIQTADMRKWTMMNVLESIGFFDIQYGRCTVDFDGQGKVSNMKVEKNYRLSPTA